MKIKNIKNAFWGMWFQSHTPHKFGTVKNQQSNIYQKPSIYAGLRAFFTCEKIIQTVRFTSGGVD